mgnify:CR=1 FL=1
MLLIKVTIVGLCIIVPQYVNANSFNGYLVDNSGNVVVTPFGECVKSGEWSHSRKHHDCNQQLKSLAKTDHQLRSILEEMDGQSSVIIEVIEKTIKQINNISGESVEARDLDAQSVLADHHCDQNYQAEGGGHQYRVAVSLLVGLCEPVDNLRDEVRMLLRESIDYGYAPAMNVYGYLLVDGALLGYSDTERAFDYLHRAIKEDDLDAHYNLGFMYEMGKGVSRDYKTAHKWYTSAANQGFSVGAEIFDQSGKAMEGSVSLKIISPENVETEISVQAGEFGEFDFAFNSSVGTWKIASSFNDMAVEREFEMLGVQKVDLGFEDSILTVTNIGNVVYNKTLDIQIGEETLNLDLNIDIGEIRKFNINAPSGAYDVVINDGDSSISRRVLLTGNAISVESLKEVGIFKGYSIVWIFLIIVLGGVGTVLFMRYRKTRTLGKDGVVKKMVGKVRDKVPGKVKSSVGDSMNFTKKSPAVQGLDDKNYSHEDKTMVDLTKNKVGIAESTLVLKGEKYVSAVVSLSVKNFGELGEAAKSALHGAVNSAQKKKGLVDWRGDYVFIVFSPLVTKTYKNEALAAKVGMEILDELNAYNKKFKDKITFNLGVHVGELIASKTGGKLKYTSIGNTISLAKRISDSASGKLIVSDPIRKKLIRDLKVTKAKEIGENQTFEVSAIKDRSGDKARLDDLLKRQK